MPLPLGHAAVGAAVYYVCANPSMDIIKDNWLVLGLFILVLSNLPDIDFIFGLFYGGDGSIMHRGPTHSIYFAFIFGWIFYLISRRSDIIPDVGFITCSLIILSHPILDIVSDMWFRKYFAWQYFSKLFSFPFLRTGRNIGFWDILNAIYEKSLGDYKIVLLALTIILLIYIVRKIF